MKLLKLLTASSVVVTGLVGTVPALAQMLRINNVRKIHQLYSENELAAKTKFHGKTAIVSGRVDRVADSELIIEGNGEFGRLFCIFSNADVDKVIALRTDARVTVAGTLDLSPALFGLSLKMNNCRVQ